MTMAAIKVEVFSASTCNRCTQAKLHIQTLVDEFDEGAIDYREVDVLDELWIMPFHYAY